MFNIKNGTQCHGLPYIDIICFIFIDCLKVKKDVKMQSGQKPTRTSPRKVNRQQISTFTVLLVFMFVAATATFWHH